MACVLDDDKWYLFGGTTSATLNTSNLWCFNFTKEEWTLIKPTSGLIPPPLDSCSACLYKADDGRSYIVVFGGFVGGTRGEYWNQVLYFDIASKRWILPYSNENEMEYDSEYAPAPRCGHSATIYNNKMYIFGGTNGEFRFNDIWVFDLVRKSWEKINTKENPPVISLFYNSLIINFLAKKWTYSSII